MNLIYVADAVRAILLAANNSWAHGHTYNLAADETSPTQREFIHHLCELLQLPPPTGAISYAAAHRLGFLSECVAHATGYHVRPPLTRLSVLLLGGHRHFVNQKLRDELGWEPLVPFADGLRRTVEWYLGHGRPPSPINVSLRVPETTPSAPHTDESSPADRPTPDRAARPAAK
jgi:nucleoside-diphosphate-sugar epimerase